MLFTELMLQASGLPTDPASLFVLALVIAGVAFVFIAGRNQSRGDEGEPKGRSDKDRGAM
jgi:hypothetical protein